MLDAILHALIEEARPAAEITLPGIGADEVERVAGLVRKSAFKRLQAAPLLPVGQHAFGVHVHM